MYLNSFAQSSKTVCDILIDPEYKGSIPVFDSPGGKSFKMIKQDFKNEDYLVFSILNQTSGFFYGTLTYSISGKAVKGWVKKATYIGTYARNYAPGTKLNLYLNPTEKSGINSIVPDWTNKLYEVTSFDKDWVYVKIVYNGKLKQGWLAPDMQCSNPYTTCN